MCWVIDTGSLWLMCIAVSVFPYVHIPFQTELQMRAMFHCRDRNRQWQSESERRNPKVPHQIKLMGRIGIF